MGDVVSGCGEAEVMIVEGVLMCPVELFGSVERWRLWDVLAAVLYGVLTFVFAKLLFAELCDIAFEALSESPEEDMMSGLLPLAPKLSLEALLFWGVTWPPFIATPATAPRPAIPATDIPLEDVFTCSPSIPRPFPWDPAKGGGSCDIGIYALLSPAL